MNLLDLHLHLRIAGVLLALLALMHAFLPRRFNWHTDLAKLSLLNRQIFIVHCLFLVLLLLLMAALSLAGPPLLLRHDPLAAAVSGGLAFFWLCRLAAQFFVYSPTLWRGHRFNTTMHVIFSGLWTYFTAVYAAACAAALH